MAPIVPPSRTKTRSRPKANFIARLAASTYGPVVTPLYAGAQEFGHRWVTHVSLSSGPPRGSN